MIRLLSRVDPPAQSRRSRHHRDTARGGNSRRPSTVWPRTDTTRDDDDDNMMTFHPRTTYALDSPCCVNSHTIKRCLQHQSHSYGASPAIWNHRDYRATMEKCFAAGGPMLRNNFSAHLRQTDINYERFKWLLKHFYLDFEITAHCDC